MSKISGAIDGMTKRAWAAAFAFIMAAGLLVAPQVSASEEQLETPELSETAHGDSLAEEAGSAPTILGQPRVGQEIRATIDYDTWPEGATFRPQWLADGEPIVLETGWRFTPSVAQYGKVLTVKVTVSTDAGVIAISESLPTPPVLAAPQTVTPSIPSAAAVGDVITVEMSTAGWAPGTEFTFEWLADGVVIDGETAPTLTVTRGLAEKRIVVRVTGEAFGYTPQTLQSQVCRIDAYTPELTFRDVDYWPTAPNYSEFYTEIEWMATEGITTGYELPGGVREYRPFRPVTRDAMAAFLYRAAGSPEVTLPEEPAFVDVSPSNPFYKEISWFATAGIATGWDVGNGKKEFRPYNNITRDAMAAFLYRYASRPSFEAPAVSPFADVTPRSSFYKEITWLASTGISTGWAVGESTQFRPFSPITRDAMAAFLYRNAHLDN